jgi:hypothetical protein
LNDDDPVAVAADALAVQLTSWTFGSWTSEKVLQEAMHPRLSAVWEVWREVRLSPQDRIDFIVTLPCSDGKQYRIGIEVKIQGAATGILRQLYRYARSDRVDALILASTRRTLLSGVPRSLYGKHIAVALLRPA